MLVVKGKRIIPLEKRIEHHEEEAPALDIIKDRRLIKEEVTRRLVSGIRSANLEYDTLFNQVKANLNKDSELLSELFHRMFFYQLNVKLSGLHCDHTFRLTRQLLTQMQFNRGKINEILDVFKKNGVHCDCEVLYYVESQLIGKS